MAIKDQRRHGNRQPESSVVERNRNTMRQLRRVGAGRILRAKDLNHPDHRAKQTHQGCQRGNRAQRGQITFQPMCGSLTGFFDGLLHHLTRRIQIAQASGQHLSQWRILFQLVDHVCIEATMLIDTHHFGQ